ncbi:MAG: hypothetical protein ABIK39_00680 [candidate division WOR-3 bacterium]
MRFRPGILFLLLLACSDTLLFRSSADYFPLRSGAQWKYLRNCSDTVYVQVDTSSAVLLGQNCIRVYRNFAPEYYTLSPTEVRRLFLDIFSRPGTTEDTIAWFGLLYQLPLVLGNSYEERFDTTLIWGSDTLKYSHTLTAKVAAIVDTLTPAGTFYDCYRIEFSEKKIIDQETTDVKFTELLAPETGIIARHHPDFDEILVFYQSKPQPTQ